MGMPIGATRRRTGRPRSLGTFRRRRQFTAADAHVPRRFDANADGFASHLQNGYRDAFVDADLLLQLA
jgi:hypothetical protein